MTNNSAPSYIQAGAALLARLLVHDPRARASWPEFFGCEFLRAEEPPL